MWRVMGLLTGVGAFVLAFYTIPLREVWAVMQESFDLALIIGCVLIWILNIFFQSLRWHIMLNAAKSVAFAKTFRLFILYRWSNFVLPFRAGEGVRVVSASKLLNIRMPFLMATSVNERLLNFAFLIVLAFALNFFMPILRPYRWLFLGIMGLLATGTLWLFWQNRGPTGDLTEAHPKTSSLSIIRGSRVRRFLKSFAQGITILGRPEVLVGTVLSTIAFLGCVWLVITLLQQRLPMDHRGLSALVIILFTNIASLLAMTPANLGPFEWGCIFAMSLFGIPKGAALGFSLVLQSIRIASVALLGMSLLGASALLNRRSQADT